MAQTAGPEEGSGPPPASHLLPAPGRGDACAPSEPGKAEFSAEVNKKPGQHPAQRVQLWVPLPLPGHGLCMRNS